MKRGRKPELFKLLLIAVCILINFAGAKVALALKLPVYWIL